LESSLKSRGWIQYIQNIKYNVGVRLRRIILS